MTAVAAAPARFDMGRVVGRTFGAVGRNFIVFYLLATIVMVGPLIMMMSPAYVTAVTGQPSDPANPLAMFTPLYFGGLALYALGTNVLTAALTHGAVMHFSGRSAGIGECVATGVRFFLPVFVIGVLSALGIGFGLILFIVPGLMIMTAWAVVIPAEVIERTGILGAFPRSGGLTSGHRWAIFFLLFVVGIMNYVIEAVAGVVAQAIISTNLLNPIWAVVIATTLTYPIITIISAVGVASIYFELRHIKEGVLAEQLAAVFD